MKRRQLLKMGLSTSALVGISTIANAAQLCKKTPSQTEGPFYPVNPQKDTNWDLLHVEGQSTRAIGEEIFVIGQVKDQNCEPVSDALVEIWQACASGKYNHPNDPNPAPLDPNFQYWGRSLTNNDGFYFFRTLIPGSYPAANDWVRPPHIHYKVLKRNYIELTTQLYFAGQSLNNSDKILQRLPPADQKKVVRPIETQKIDVPEEGIKEARVVRFDLEIEKL